MNGTVPVTRASKKRIRAYGDGSIIKLGPDRYRVVVSGGRDPISGKRIRPSVYAPTLDEARIKKAELLGQRLSASGPITVDRNLTLGAYLDDWIAKKRDNERTHHFRLDKLRPVQIALGAVRLHRLTDEQIDQLINVTLNQGAAPLAPRTRKHIHSVLRTALKDACESATIKLARNPAQTVKVKGFRDEFDPRILDDREAPHAEPVVRRARDQRLHLQVRVLVLLHERDEQRRAEVIAQSREVGVEIAVPVARAVLLARRQREADATWEAVILLFEEGDLDGVVRGGSHRSDEDRTHL